MSKNFSIRQISPDFVEETLKDIGFDRGYLKQALKKYDFALYKIKDLTCQQATILKQAALSVGADAALHREVITCKVEKTGVLLGCTLSQLKIICEKLKKQPFSLSSLAENLSVQTQIFPKPLIIRNTTFNWGKKTYVMGILNCTPDSFSDGGKYFSLSKAVEQAEFLIDSGADIIDIGGESTRPFAEKVDAEEESSRVVPVIQKIREKNSEIIISIDTRNSLTAEKAIEAGADIINDVSGLCWDENMVSVAVKTQAPVIIMHSTTSPKTMQINPTYSKNVVDEVYDFLAERVDFAVNSGIAKEKIILDVGFGFGKNFEHNIELIQRFEEFKSLGCALLAGISRKSVIGKVLNLPPEDREEATISLNSYLVEHGADIIRVHDVRGNFRAIKVLDKVIRRGI